MFTKSCLHNIIIFNKHGLNRYSFPTYVRKLCSSVNKKNVLHDKPFNDFPGEYTEQLNESSYATGFVEPVRINSLNIVRNIETLQKNDSIFYNYFLGTYDKDLLNYPILLKTRKEFHQMNDQYEMIRQTWSKIKKDTETLDLLGYQSLYNLSVSEMMFIFEAIGAGSQKHYAFGTKEDKEYRFENKMNRSFNVAQLNSAVNIEPNVMKTFSDARQSISAIMPLILRNSLVYYALYNSQNTYLKELILNEKSKIGFGYLENENNQINDISNFSTEAKLSSESDSWVVSGEKCGIIKDDYSHYLLVCKTTEFPDKQPFDGDLNEKNGIVALLIPADQVEVEKDTSDYFGIEYQRIKFSDVKLARNCSEVIPAQQDSTNFLNIKGCGQLATSATILGLLKQLLKNTYADLVNNKIGLINSELIQYKLYQATRNIYAIESTLYLTAAMFDSFEAGASMVGESLTVKSLTTEYAYDVIRDLKSIFGSRYPFSSTALESIHLLDSMLGSSIENRLSIGRSAVQHYKSHVNLIDYKSYLKAPIYSVKRYLKFKKIQERDLFPPGEMNKYVHHNLHVACQWIENVIIKLESSTNFLINHHKENIMQRHVDLNRLATMSMDIFVMISVLSRANHAMCYGRRNNDTEKELCLALCKELFIKHIQTFEDITRETKSNNDEFAQNIFRASLKQNGYFPSIFDHQFEDDNL